MDHLDAHRVRANEFIESGNIEEALKIYREGIGKRKRTLGPDHPKTIESYDTLSTLYMKIGQYNKAFSVYNGLQSGNNLRLQLPIKLCQAGKCKKALRFIFEVQEVIMNDVCVNNSFILDVKSVIAYVYGAMNNYAMALRYHDNVFVKYLHVHGPSHPKTLSSLASIASTLRDRGNFDEALDIVEKIYEVRKNALGLEHEDTLIIYKGIGMIYTDLGKYDKALDVYKECYEIQLRVRPEHPDTLATRSLIAIVLQKKGKYDEALQILSGIYAIQERKYPLKCDTSVTKIRIADVYKDKRDYSKAICNYQDVRESFQSCPDHTVKIDSENKIATVLIKQGKYHDASEILQTLYARCLVSFGPECNETLSVVKNMAKLLCAHRMYYDALLLFIEIHKVKERTCFLGPRHPETMNTLCDIAESYAVIGKYNKALDIYKKISEARLALFDNEHPDYLSVQSNIASVYSQIGKYNEAFQILYEVFEMKTKIFGADHKFTKDSEQEMLRLSGRLDVPNIIKATIDNDLLAVKRCIQEGDNVNVRHKDGSVPLHIASKNGSTKIIEVLLKNSAIYNIKNMRGKKPENVSKDNATKQLFKEIHSLFECAKENNCEEAALIIRNKTFIVNAKDRTGCTPLHWASKKGCVNIANLLLEKGSDITSVNKSGNTPFHFPACVGNNEILEVFLKYMMQHNLDVKKVINAKTSGRGTTALHIASKNCHLDTVKLLLEYGADSSIADKLGKLPVDYATKEVKTFLASLVTPK